MLVQSLFFVAAIATLATSAPASLNHVLHEKRDVSPADWVKGSRVGKGAILPMRIGLTQTNLEKGQEFIMDVSSPDSPNYGKHWSMDQVHEMFAPTEETVNAVKAWLTSFGIADSRIVVHDNKGWLAFDATVEEAEELLLTEYHEHNHSRSPKIRVGCDRYHVPKHISPHIDYISPGVKLAAVVKTTVIDKRSSAFSPKKTSGRIGAVSYGFPAGYKPPGAASLPADVQGCGTNITPPCYFALYQLPSKRTASPGNSLGLFEQGDYFSKTDIDMFFKSYAPWVPQGTYPKPALIDGAQYGAPANDTLLVTGESDLDIDIATSIIFPQTITLYQTDDQIYGPNEVSAVNTFNTFLDALDGSYCTYAAYGETGNDPTYDPIYPDPAAGGYKGKLQCGVFKPTNVISASYGESEQDLPINYQKRQCSEFMKLGLQGHSILVSSGDFGVSGYPSDPYRTYGCLGPTGLIFNPQYPSNCPYVTSVGATQLYPDQTVLDKESVMQVDLGFLFANFSSAGGFANFFPQPAWQKAAVAEYFEIAKPTYPYYSELEVNLSTTKGIYNRIGRGFPDVSANGAFMLTYINGKEVLEYGTSLASPLFASVLTLLNEDRFTVGKGPIGFVSPALYAHPNVLNDITNGTNLGCGTQGFHAAKGWDPSTGLGTPNYPKMKELFLSLP